MTAPITTARLDLRVPRSADVPAFVKLAGAREVAATTKRIPHPYAPEDGHRFVAAATDGRADGSSDVRTIVRRLDAAVVGCIGLDIDVGQASAELGYWIGVPYWGQGFATEAASAMVQLGFGPLALARIHAHHLAVNRASGRVLEKVGMAREGVRRRHIVKWGTRHDIVYYGILPGEEQPSACP